MVLIHRIQRTPEHIGVLEQLTEDAENGKLKIVVSTYTLAEVIKDPDGKMLSKEEDEKIVGLFENPYFIVRPVTLPIALLSRKISRELGTKPKDAIHLATASYWNVPEFLTYERGLLNKDGKIGNPPLRINIPDWKGQPNLIASIKSSDKVSDEEIETDSENAAPSPDVQD
jgi:predicted nucleic acid-binding protein